jgi:hypothetical protein
MVVLRLVGALLVRYGAVMGEDRKAARGSAGRHLSGGFGEQGWLASLLRDATGVDGVVPETRPDADAAVMIRISKAIGSQSTERLSLWWQAGSLALGTWPGELKKQAEATYRTGRGQRIVEFAAGMPAGWRVWPNLYLGHWRDSIPQRVYLTCGLGLAEYVHGWQGEDFAFVGAHHLEQVRPVLWPRLLDRGYADVGDESRLAGFLDRLGKLKRDAHLRPGIGLQRTWSRAEAAGTGQRGALAGEVRAAVTEVLGVLDEPLPPACAARRP